MAGVPFNEYYGRAIQIPEEEEEDDSEDSGPEGGDDVDACDSLSD